MRTVEPPPGIEGKWKYNELLDELSGEHLLKLSEIEGMSYPYWEKWKYRAQEWKLDPLKLWSIVKTMRSRGNRIDFNNLGHFPLRFNTPLIIQERLHELDRDLGGMLNAGGIIPEEQKKYYLMSSLMEEAIASSQIEGAATTRKIAREMLESNRKPTNISERMIANNYEVMQWIVKNKDIRLTPEYIREIHLMITRQTLTGREEEGAFRTTDDIQIMDVQTGNVVHTPPGHDQLEKLIEEFCIFANDERKPAAFLHPISKAISIHFLMGYIHPFTDGNGRTARALFYWYLIKKGYGLIEYMSVSRVILGSKAKYTRAYLHTELDQMDLTYFILYNLGAIRVALADLKKYVEHQQREKKNILGILQETDYNDRQMAILQQILTEVQTVFVVQAIESRFDVSNQTARNDLNLLVSRGILQTRTVGKRIQYIATPEAAKRIKQ
jgi:Fic family protein